MWSRGGGVCIMLSMGGGVGVPAIIPGKAPYGAEARLLCGGMLGNWFCIGGLLKKNRYKISVYCENERALNRGLDFENHTGSWDHPSWIVRAATWAAACFRSGRGPKTGERVNFLKTYVCREDEHVTTATSRVLQYCLANRCYIPIWYPFIWLIAISALCLWTNCTKPQPFPGGILT